MNLDRFSVHCSRFNRKSERESRCDERDVCKNLYLNVVGIGFRRGSKDCFQEGSYGFIERPTALRPRTSQVNDQICFLTGSDLFDAHSIKCPLSKEVL